MTRISPTCGAPDKPRIFLYQGCVEEIHIHWDVEYFICIFHRPPSNTHLRGDLRREVGPRVPSNERIHLEKKTRLVYELLLFDYNTLCCHPEATLQWSWEVAKVSLTRVIRVLSWKISQSSIKDFSGKSKPASFSKSWKLTRTTDWVNADGSFKSCGGKASGRTVGWSV